MLKWLGSIGKGFATAVGTITAGVGVVTSLIGHSGAITDAFHTIVASGSATIAAVGALLAIFGIGRKAGATIADGKELPK